MAAQNGGKEIKKGNGGKTGKEEEKRERRKHKRNNPGEGQIEKRKGKKVSNAQVRDD